MNNESIKPIIKRPWIETPKYKISVLLPTRGRTDSLKRSLLSLVNLAADPENIEILLGVDDDDKATQDWIKNNIIPDLSAKLVDVLAVEFRPLGYGKLHDYVNTLARFANGSWIFFWNDDAVMETAGWDQEIAKFDREFVCLRMITHNEHPYAIFPIVPIDWFYLLGHLSKHQLNDAWISQVAYMVGIVETIPVSVTHDRHDLTGNNSDDTFRNRIIFEGRPDDPRDFNHVTARQHRIEDANKIGWYLKTTGKDYSWIKRVMAGEQDPWEKMIGENDPNGQVRKYT